MNSARVLFLTLVAAALLASAQVSAITYIVPSDEDLVRSADAIVIGTPVSSRAFLRDGTIHTAYAIEIEQVLKGNVSRTRRIEIVERGGVIEGRGLFVPGSPVYRKGERSLIFLDASATGYRTLGLGLGKFTYVLSPENREFVVRGENGEQIFGYDATGALHKEVVRSAREFTSFIRDVVAGLDVTSATYTEIPSAFRASPSAKGLNLHAPPASAYLLAGVPWGSASIPMRNNGGQSGVSDTPGLISGSMSVWNGDPNSSVNLTHAGTTGSGATQDGQNVIVFNSTTLPAGTVGFTDLYIAGNIVEADVRIANGVSGALTENILIHEFGHVLGFRHSDNNEGNPSANVAVMNISTAGRPNSLAAWDILAVSTVYGGSPVCPTSFITAHPQDTTIPPGGSANLSVGLGSDQINPTTGQWYMGESGDTSNPVPGATSSNFTTTIPGRYWVRVTNGCDNTQNSNAATVTAQECTAATITSHPQSQNIQSGQTATLSVSASGTDPKTYLWRQVSPGGGSTPAPGFNTGTQYTTPALTTTTSYFAEVSNCAGLVNSNVATITVASACANPVITQQPGSATVNAGQSVIFTVSATGTAPLTYQWFIGTVGDTSRPVGSNAPSYNTGPLTANVTVWVRVTNTCPGSVAANSSNATATVLAVCNTDAPQLSAPPTAAFNTPYDAVWTSAQGDVSYEIQESTSENFSTGVTTRTVTTLSSSFSHSVVAPTPYFYRVRANRTCNGVTQQSAFSPTVRVVVNPTPVPQPPPLDGLELSVPIDSTTPVSFPFVLLPPAGVPEAQFTATTQEPWLSVAPASGTVTTSGRVLTVTAQPGMLPPGSSTAPVFISFTFADKGGPGLHGSATAAVPVGVGKVPPASATPKSPNVPNNALIFPAVAQLDGRGASFVSDVRLANTSSQPITYRLQFTPSGINGLTAGQRSTVTVPAGGTIAFNSILKQFFGIGTIPGEGAKGVLEVRPENFSNKGEAFDARSAYATVGSSRTYARTEQGTFGQFIPGIPFDRFVGRTTNTAQPNRLSLQQIAQSAAFRTNLGLVEAAGEPATVRIQVFNTSGARLDEFFVNLQPGEHRQIDQYLTTRGLTLDDGRIEIEVTSDTGRVSAYASVLDNVTADPLLVEPVRIGETQSNKFIVPGVADIKNPNASWRSDMRIFNPTAGPVNATLLFYPAGAPGSPLTRNVTIGANQILAMDNLLEATFNTTGTGAVHVETANQSQLIVTARTYDQRPSGSYGQFIPAVTSSDAAGLGDRSLQVLQLEQSDRFRTNLGLVETNGQPVTVEVAALIPGRATAPIRIETLAANEFRQLNSVLSTMGIPSAFNARVTIRVIGGTGRIAAYGSVVDNLTQDPTYVPSQ